MANSMSKKEMEKELRRLLIALMNGGREEFKQAKKEIASLWHRQTEAFKSSAEAALEFLPKFDEIGKDINKEAFASGLSFFYLTLADDHFAELKNFTLKVIQHPDGHIRQAVLKTADWLFCSLTGRAEPFVYPKGKALTEKQREEQAIASEQYLSYVKEVEALLEKYDTGEEVEYINQMKPSIGKSLQQLWGRLTEGPVYRRILESIRPVPGEILMKRKEIEWDLAGMLKETGSDFSLDDVKGAIFDEEGNDGLMKILAMLDRGGDASELSNILELLTDAWNYFPHRALNGLSPTEITAGKK